MAEFSATSAASAVNEKFVFICGYSLHFFGVSEHVPHQLNCRGRFFYRLYDYSLSIGQLVQGWLCGYEVIMQNKANLPDTQMFVTSVNIKSYEQITMNNEPEKQTQSNPNKLEAHRVGSCLW